MSYQFDFEDLEDRYIRRMYDGDYDEDNYDDDDDDDIENDYDYDDDDDDESYNSDAMSGDSSDDEMYFDDIDSLLTMLGRKKDWMLPSSKKAGKGSNNDDSNGDEGEKDEYEKEEKDEETEKQKESTHTHTHTQLYQSRVTIVNRIVSLIAHHPEAFLQFLSSPSIRHWDTLLQLIRHSQDNKIVQSFLSHVVIDEQRGWTLLHWLCSEGGTPIQILKALLHHFPVRKTDTQSTAMTVDTTCTEMIIQRDTHHGDTCLHLLCRNTCHSSAKKLRLLLKAMGREDAQKAVLIRNRSGGTVLHAATYCGTSWETIHTIVSVNPNVLQVVAGRGESPIRALWHYYVNTVTGQSTLETIIEEVDPITDSTCTMDETTTTDNNLLCRVQEIKDPSFHVFWKKVEYLSVRQFLLMSTQQDGRGCNESKYEYIIQMVV
jgi:hypothetical protein